MAEKIILFTGGGSAGHVTPNIALMGQLQKEGWQVHYAGTRDGIEHTLVGDLENVEYHVIQSGKLRRYFSLKNFTDPFRVIKGISQAKKLAKEIKPHVVFSKGGFVSVPVVLGSHRYAPVVLHESDYSPGLANRIAIKKADRVCVTFEDTLSHVGSKGVFTGTPIRSALYGGDKARGLAFTGLSGEKPVLLMMGGSLGAQAVNEALRAALPELLPRFDIVHLCGKGKLDEAAACPGYVQYEYISQELPDLLAMADIVLSRAGANAVFEFLALKKPALLIPLSMNASRGDQIQNARYFEKRGYARVLPQEEMTPQSLIKELNALYDGRESYLAAMEQAPHTDGTDGVLAVIRAAATGPKGRK